MRTIGATLLLAALASPALAQVFVVDVNNGPGTNFTQIAAASAAVPDGAVLQVRAGVYDPFAIQSKSLTVLGEPGVAVLTGLQTPIRVTGLLADQSVTLRQLSWSSTFFAATELLCQNCLGTVLIDKCSAVSTGSAPGGRVRADACDRLLLRDTSLIPGVNGEPALHASNSNVAVIGCSLESIYFTLLLTQSRVHLTSCSITGAGLGFGATHIFGGDLVINGSTTIDGGTFGGILSPAITGTGTVALDPSTTFVNATNPAIATTLTAQNRSIPLLGAATGPLGGQATAVFQLANGSSGFLLVGFPASPAALPGLADPTWLAPGAALHSVGSSPFMLGGYGVPNAAWVLGIQIGWQGITLDSNGAIAASNPAAYAHH